MSSSAATVPVVVPPPDLGRETLPAFQEQLEVHLGPEAQGPGVVIDLAPVRFINSTALGYIVTVGKRLAEEERRIALARPQKRTERLLQIVGLGAILPRFRTLPEAQEFVASPRR